MAKSDEKITFKIIPSATNLIESMRSIGYSFETALSDIIDNSISASATQINIFMEVENENPFIQIVDNGTGMNEIELINAMRLGSKSPNEKRDTSDLGRFGLGLKSASFSQCKELTVISKKEGHINALMWDLDYVAKTDSFDVIKINDSQFNDVPNIDELYNLDSGTLVMWRNFDRISISTNDLRGELSTLMSKARDHISLVYHRIMNSSLKININYNNIEPKDPYLSNHPATQMLQSKNILLDEEVIKMQPYVLPHFSSLSAEDRRLSGKIEDHYKSQGFYLYRNKRLIVWGDYLGLNKKSELTKNLRILVDIPNNLDYLWDIDIKKSSAKVPSKIMKNLFSGINDGESVSKKVNKFRGRKERENTISAWDFYRERDDNFRLNLNKKHPLYSNLTECLDSKQIQVLDLYLSKIEENIPTNLIYSEIASGHKLMGLEEQHLLENLKQEIIFLKTIPNFDYIKYLRTYYSDERYNSSKVILDFLDNEMENI